MHLTSTPFSLRIPHDPMPALAARIGASAPARGADGRGSPVGHSGAHGARVRARAQIPQPSLPSWTDSFTSPNRKGKAHA